MTLLFENICPALERMRMNNSYKPPWQFFWGSQKNKLYPRYLFDLQNVMLRLQIQSLIQSFINYYFSEPLHDSWQFTSVSNIATKGLPLGYVCFGINEQCPQYENIYDQPSYLDVKNHNLFCCRSSCACIPRCKNWHLCLHNLITCIVCGNCHKWFV